MAGSIGAALAQIKQELDQWIDQATMDRVCREEGHRWRVRVLDPLRTVHLMLLQLLAQVGLSGLRHVAQLAVSAQAVCAARQRLPLGVLLKLLEQSCSLACAGAGAAEKGGQLWQGLRVFLADGMSVLAPDTPALRGKFGKGSNQHGESCSYPLPKLLDFGELSRAALLDFGSGLVRQVITLPHARNEKTCLARLLSHLSPGDLLLCDRGLSSFAHVALMVQRQIACCIGLPLWLSVIGKGKGCHRRLKRLGENDLLAGYPLAGRIKGDRRPTWMSKRAWSALPAELILRQVNLRVRRPGFRNQWLRVITTLSDAKLYPAAAIAELYARRWQVEVYFRDLKVTLGMKQLSSRTVLGMRKEVVAFMLLYNLVRQVMARAAQAQGVTPDRISFIDAARWLLWAPADGALPKLRINRKRSRPGEPRVLKHGRRKYPQMTRPREALRKTLRQSGKLRRQS